jgi:hypothetical protein
MFLICIWGGARFELGPKYYLLWRTFSWIFSVLLCNVRFNTFNYTSIRTTSLHFPSRGLLSRYHLPLNSELLLFYCLCVVWDWGHLARWSLFGPLYMPWMIRSVEQWVDWLRRETELLAENFPQCHFVPQQTDMTWSGLETGPLQCKSGGERTSRHWIVLSREM